MSHDADQDLQAMQTAQSYLKLSRIYADYLGGLRWAATEDAMVHVDGRLFAFNEAIATFVDGFASQGRAIPFGYLLHWMDLLLNQRQLSAPAIQELRALFLETGGNWRNAGAFAATMSADVPEPPVPVDLERVSQRLRNRAFPIRWFLSQFRETSFEPGLSLPVGPETFELLTIASLAGYSEDDLRAWLSTGRGPIRHARQLVEDLPLPRNLAGLLTALLERPRLAGAQTYVAQLIGALALPPRRFVPQELPVGGYSDIVTRGQVEHLLPAQFALDEMEFLRRFTENELLYFRREEPPAQTRQEMVVLLDQGVRTWGDVRLVLTAAALAYGKHATLRKTPFFLAMTSNDGHVIDPMDFEPAALGEWLEASDLSLNPGLALESLLETPAEAMRDVVLLTHPRNLRESDVLDAARRLGANDRLFAVALDGHGQVEISEVRHGTPIKLRQFHVDFRPSTPKPRPNVARDGVPSTMWTGDVEAIPYPFRLGTEPHLTHFDFDYEGRWLLTVSGQGTLHLWKLDGFSQEMLPRPFFKQVLKKVIGVIGVLGGFVVAARVDNSLIFANYDIIRRRCKTYAFNPYTHDAVRLYYDREPHTLMMLDLKDRPIFTIDLRVDAPHFVPILDAGASHPATIAPTRLPPSNRLVHLAEWEATSEHHSEAAEYPAYAEHDHKAGTLSIHEYDGATFRSYDLMPTMDGKRCLREARVMSVQIAGSTLALRAKRLDIREAITVMHCPDGAILREYPAIINKQEIRRYLLSFDGRRIALERSQDRIEVDSVYDGDAVPVSTRVGGFTLGGRIFGGKHSVVLKLGTFRHQWHLFFWGDGKLVHRYERPSIRGHESADFSQFQSFAPLLRQVPPLDAGLTNLVLPVMEQDRERFAAVIGGYHLWFLVDRFGQVAVLDRREKLLAMLVAFRDQWSAWMPDGTRLGSLGLNNGPATPGAAERIGRTLLDAEKEADQ